MFAPSKHPETGVLETSVCTIPMADDARLLELGQTIRAKEGLAALAVAIVPVTSLPKPLAGHAAPEPNYAEHAIIAGWPSGEDNKSARILLQQQIAANAEPVRRY